MTGQVTREQLDRVIQKWKCGAPFSEGWFVSVQSIPALINDLNLEIVEEDLSSDPEINAIIEHLADVHDHEREQLADLKAENARLRKALDIILKADEEENGGEMWYAEALVEAINEARAVLKETDQ